MVENNSVEKQQTSWELIIHITIQKNGVNLNNCYGQQ